MQKLESIEHYYQAAAEKQVLFFFTADWCPDCQVIKPIMPEMDEKYPEYDFIEVDRDEFIDLCHEQNVFGIPSFIAYREGKETGRFVGKERKTKKEIELFMNSL